MQSPGNPILPHKNSPHCWIVEYDAKDLAILYDPEFEDMFWVSYRLAPLTPDPAAISLLYSDDFWNQVFTNRVKFRNLQSHQYAPHVLPCGNIAERLATSNRLAMRGLYVLPPPTFLSSVTRPITALFINAYNNRPPLWLFIVTSIAVAILLTPLSPYPTKPSNFHHILLHTLLLLLITQTLATTLYQLANPRSRCRRKLRIHTSRRAKH